MNYEWTGIGTTVFRDGTVWAKFEDDGTAHDVVHILNTLSAVNAAPPVERRWTAKHTLPDEERGWVVLRDSFAEMDGLTREQANAVAALLNGMEDTA